MLFVGRLSLFWGRRIGGGVFYSSQSRVMVVAMKSIAPIPIVMSAVYSRVVQVFGVGVLVWLLVVLRIFASSTVAIAWVIIPMRIIASAVIQMRSQFSMVEFFR